VVAREECEHTRIQVADEAGEAAAIGDDGVAEFVPEGSIEQAGRDAEIMADVDDDGADRAATDFGSDFLFGGEARGARVLGVVGGLGFRLGVRWRDLPGGAGRAGGGYAEGCWGEVLAAVGAAAKRGFQGRGSAQAAGDAGENHGEVGGAEGCGEAWGGGALLDCAGEMLAEVDEFADEAEDAVEAAGYGWDGPGRIGVCDWGGGLGGGGHERNKNIMLVRCQGKTRALARTPSILRAQSRLTAVIRPEPGNCPGRDYANRAALRARGRRRRRRLPRRSSSRGDMAGLFYRGGFHFPFWS
jgi:hypothetical protein